VEYLKSLLEVCTETSRIPGLLKVGVITFIPKPGKSLKKPDSWRPITLLPVFYKIISSVIRRDATEQLLARGLMPSEQWGLREGEQGATDVVFLLQSVIEDARVRRRDIHIAFHDLRNAFGSIHLGYFIQAINATGLPINLRKLWVASLEGTRVRLRFKGRMSNSISVKCGTPQGGPHSPLSSCTPLFPLIRLIREECVGYRIETPMPYSIPDGKGGPTDPARPIFRPRPKVGRCTSKQEPHQQPLAKHGTSTTQSL
jgi:hypothetical protein